MIVITVSPGFVKALECQTASCPFKYSNGSEAFTKFYIIAIYVKKTRPMLAHMMTLKTPSFKHKHGGAELGCLTWEKFNMPSIKLCKCVRDQSWTRISREKWHTATSKLWCLTSILCYSFWSSDFRWGNMGFFLHNMLHVWVFAPHNFKLNFADWWHERILWTVHSLHANAKNKTRSTGC